MKLRKINKILQDPTTSKRLKKEIHYLFEKLEMVSFHRDILQNNKPVESTEQLFNQHKGGEIVVLKALKTIPGIITKGDLYYATSNDKYYFFSNDKGIPTHVLIEGMECLELLPIKETKGL